MRGFLVRRKLERLRQLYADICQSLEDDSRIVYTHNNRLGLPTFHPISSQPVNRVVERVILSEDMEYSDDFEKSTSDNADDIATDSCRHSTKSLLQDDIPEIISPEKVAQNLSTEVDICRSIDFTPVLTEQVQSTPETTLDDIERPSDTPTGVESGLMNKHNDTSIWDSMHSMEGNIIDV